MCVSIAWQLLSCFHIGINAEKILSGQEKLSINTGNMKSGRAKGKVNGADDSDLEELMAGFDAAEDDESLSALVQNEVPAITNHSKSNKAAVSKASTILKTAPSKAKKLVQAMSEGVDSDEETLGSAIATKKKEHKVLSLEKMSSKAKEILSKRNQSRKNRADLVHHFDSDEDNEFPMARPNFTKPLSKINNNSRLNISNSTEYSSDFSDSALTNQAHKRKSPSEYNVYDVEESPPRKQQQLVSAPDIERGFDHGDLKRQNVRKLSISVAKAFRNWLCEFRKRYRVLFLASI